MELLSLIANANMEGTNEKRKEFRSQDAQSENWGNDMH
jgi:hypothetical protein